MHFSSSFTIFLASIVFADFAIAAPTAANEALVSGTGLFSKIKASKSSWDNVAKACASGATKRDLEARAPPPGFNEVKMNEFLGAGEFPLGLWTGGLVTCLGVGITGTAPASNAKANTRFLLHLPATNQATQVFQGFAAKVKESALTNMEGYLSYPELHSDMPDSGGARATQLSNEDKKLTGDMATAILDAVHELINKAPKVKVRPMSPAGTMQIDNQNHVEINGQAVA